MQSVLVVAYFDVEVYFDESLHSFFFNKQRVNKQPGLRFFKNNNRKYKTIVIVNNRGQKKN